MALVLLAYEQLTALRDCWKPLAHCKGVQRPLLSPTRAATSAAVFSEPCSRVYSPSEDQKKPTMAI
jgi:hypothetical protein